jgi:DNA-binding XRE family transcriptional regulator
MNNEQLVLRIKAMEEELDALKQRLCKKTNGTKTRRRDCGAVIQQQREKAGKTREELAEEINILPASLYRIETGLQGTTWKTLEAIGNVLSARPVLTFREKTPLFDGSLQGGKSPETKVL